MHKLAHEVYNRVEWQSQIIDTRPCEEFYKKGRFRNKSENHIVGSVNLPFDREFVEQSLISQKMKMQQQI